MSPLDNQIASVADRGKGGLAFVGDRFIETALPPKSGSHVLKHGGPVSKNSLSGARKIFLVVWIGVLSAVQTGLAQNPIVNFDLETACTDVNHHGQFAGASVRLVESGVERDRVLEILSCIATHPDVDRGVGELAIRALAFIADDDSRSNRLLMEIVKAEQTDLNVVGSACRVLVYIADAGTRRELLEFAKRQWPSNESMRAMEALKDLGDDDLVTWIDQLKKELPVGNLLHGPLDRFKVYVRIQKSVLQMLAYIESDKTDLDRDWLVRQAMRRGATRGQVRSAAIAFLERTQGGTANYPRSMLVHGCEQYDIFRPEDVSKYKSIQESREGHLSVDRPHADWQKVFEVKRAEFYRQKRKQ